MCSERYAEETPFGFWKYQLPPTSSEPRSTCAGPPVVERLAAVSPLTPAPITQTRGRSRTAGALDRDGGRVGVDRGCGGAPALLKPDLVCAERAARGCTWVFGPRLRRSTVLGDVCARTSPSTSRAASSCSLSAECSTNATVDRPRVRASAPPTGVRAAPPPPTFAVPPAPARRA